MISNYPQVLDFKSYFSNSTGASITTLNMTFIVTYNMELCNAISIYCMFHVSPEYVKLIVWTL